MGSVFLTLVVRPIRTGAHFATIIFSVLPSANRFDRIRLKLQRQDKKYIGAKMVTSLGLVIGGPREDYSK